MVDIAIIGAGPAGLSAAVNAYARNKSVLVIGRGKETSALWKAERVANHLGMHEFSGAALMEEYLEHALALGIEVQEGRVLQILDVGKHFMLNIGAEVVEAKAVILATGVQKGSRLPGEESLLGKGVSYCATCDGMFFRGKEVVVVGELAEAEEDVNFLAGLCARVRYLPLYSGVGHVDEKAEIISGKPEAVLGDERVTGIRVNGEEIACDGVFLMKAAAPLDSLISGLQTESNIVVVDKGMRTNVPGVYACGDCTGWPLQLSKAIGEGLIAAQMAVRELNV